jgi:hypothetical protein
MPIRPRIKTRCSNDWAKEVSQVMADQEKRLAKINQRRLKRSATNPAKGLVTP